MSYYGKQWLLEGLEGAGLAAAGTTGPAEGHF